MKNIFTEHPNSTENPQGYWAHLRFGFTNSVMLLWYCLLGIVHAFFPFWFKFSTSSAIIRSFLKLVESDRHKPELHKYCLSSPKASKIEKIEVHEKAWRSSH